MNKKIVIMGLKNEERKEVVKYRLEKANDTFDEIQVLMDNKFYRTAANRLYYACYYAATALLVNDSYHRSAKVRKITDFFQLRV